MRRIWPFSQREMWDDDFDKFRTGFPLVWRGKATKTDALSWIGGTCFDLFMAGFLITMCLLLAKWAISGDGSSVSRTEALIGGAFMFLPAYAQVTAGLAHLCLLRLADEEQLAEHLIRLFALRVVLLATLGTYGLAVVVLSR